MDEIWYPDSIITNQIIFKFIYYAGISSDLDGSEDHQFRCDEDLEKGNEIIELENEVAFDKKNYYAASSGSDQ